MIEKKRTKPNYSEEFRAEALTKCAEVGISRTAKELGVSPATLRTWELKAGKSFKKSDGRPSYQELEKEVRKLKKELGYVTEINKVLKKSTAIFSSKELGGLQ